MNEQGKLSSVSSLLKKSWDQYTLNINVLVPIMLIAGVGLYLLAILAIVYPTDPSLGSQNVSFGGMQGVYGLIAGVIYIVGMIWGTAALLNRINKLDQPMGVHEAYMSAKPLVWPLFVTGVLSFLAILAGFILLIIPGIIVGIWVSFSSYVVVAEHLSGVAALKASKEYVKGYWWAVLGRSIAIGIIIAIINGIVGIIISIFSKTASTLVQDVISLSLIPLAMIYQFRIYQELRALKSGVAAPVPTQTEEPVEPAVAA